ncbi:MAG: NgoFVII family restriction endonuclease, partial [Bacteroidetes bacterium]|nr:NgoFVII family restriction endonuclease [Bacteroidota bacterium]
MDILSSIKKGGIELVSVRAYKGDAMTLLAMSIDETLKTGFTGFSIRVTAPGKRPYYLFNRFTYADEILKKNGFDPKDKFVTLTDRSPLQTFRWVHTPMTDHNINDLIYGQYKYEITPRFMKDDILQPLDKSLTVGFMFEVSPYQSGNFQVGFTRGFIESQAYTRHFGLNNKTRPNKTDLLFDIAAVSGPTAKDKKADKTLVDYTYEDQHKWLGWQARQRVIELLNETVNDKKMTLDVFAFDLDEPVICNDLLLLAADGRCRVILDNSSTHIGTSLEQKFEKLYKQKAKDTNSITRGHFQSLAHSKVFIQKKNNKPVKVLTGSTNFSTNGLYVNANHVLIIKEDAITQLYEDVFEKSFGQTLMDAFDKTPLAMNDHSYTEVGVPSMTIRFSPHTKAVAQTFFTLINKRILDATSDVLFAIMKDNS